MVTFMNAPKIEPKYVVNEDGVKESVVISVDEFRSLMEFLEDYEDALAADRAREDGKDAFEDYDKVRERWIKEGRL